MDVFDSELRKTNDLCKMFELPASFSFCDSVIEFTSFLSPSPACSFHL